MHPAFLSILSICLSCLFWLKLEMMKVKKSSFLKQDTSSRSTRSNEISILEANIYSIHALLPLLNLGLAKNGWKFMTEPEWNMSHRHITEIFVSQYKKNRDYCLNLSIFQLYSDIFYSPVHVGSCPNQDFMWRNFPSLGRVLIIKIFFPVLGVRVRQRVLKLGSCSGQIPM